MTPGLVFHLALLAWVVVMTALVLVQGRDIRRLELARARDARRIIQLGAAAVEAHRLQRECMAQAGFVHVDVETEWKQ